MCDVDRLYDEWDAVCNRVRQLEAQARDRQDYINLLEQRAMQAFEENTRIILDREEEIRRLNARITELEARLASGVEPLVLSGVEA